MTTSSRPATDGAGILAACHVHSTWSYDGSWPLEALAAAFAPRGCRLLLMTEHDRGFTQARLAEYREACRRASSKAIQLVPGIEYSDAANRVHVLVWGPVPFLGESLPTLEVLEAAALHGGVAVLAHPARKAASECFQPEWAHHLAGVEVWNRKYDGWAPGELASSLAAGIGCTPFVGLDFHTQRQMFPLAMSLDLEGPMAEWPVLECLRQGRCAPTAFGLPLGEGRFRQRLPVLRVAEHGRRRLAALKRSAVKLSKGAAAR